jgi:hypothetical protein
MRSLRPPRPSPEPGVRRALLLLGLTAVARLALAVDAASFAINIPAQDLGTALLRFATVTHQQIAFNRRLVEGRRSTPLSGTYTVAEGLQALIGSAPLQIRTLPSGVLTLAATPVTVADARSTAPGQHPVAPLASTSSADDVAVKSAPLAQITVEARRAQLEREVSKFVEEIAAPQPGAEGGLARWRVPLCAVVAGLRQEEAGSILQGVAQMARAADVPLAAENCRPNLFILVTARPQELLQGMNHGRHRIFWFGRDALPAIVDEFIATPRPVRVWYTRSMRDAWDVPPSGGLLGPAAIASAKPNELMSNVAYRFSRVFVIVDWSQLEQASLEQLADYVGMVSLAEIRLTAHVDDTRTILNLFDGTAQTAPPSRLSDWDRAFIKSLYETDPTSKLQRAQVARAMVRELIAR